jgi:MFS transporter, PPP family, 3-phenylpropionic acid transporter
MDDTQLTNSPDEAGLSSILPAPGAGLFFLVFFAGAAGLLPFFGIVFRGYGLNESRIGILTGIHPLMIILGSSVWGAVADSTGRHKLVFMTAIAGVGISAVVMSQVTAFLPLVPVFMVFSLFFAPIVPMADNATMHVLGDNGDRYGRVRIWGGVGWALSAPFIGYLVEAYGSVWSFRVFGGAMLVALLVAAFMTVPAQSARGAVAAGVRVLFTDPGWVVFLMVVFAGGVGLSAMHNFLFLYMNDLGAGGTRMGLALTIATTSELGFFFFSDRLLRKFGPRKLIVVAVIAGGVRLLGYSFTTVPWVVLVIQTLHGPAFGLLYIAGVSYAAAVAPAGMGATAQGLVTGANFGLGAFTGALTAGMMYQRYGPFVMYRFFGVFLLAVAAAYTVFLHARKRERDRVRRSAAQIP